MVSCLVVIETIRGTLRGRLTDVHPDHVVLEVSGIPYFVRIQQINWVMPTHTHSSLPHVTAPK
ncbi:hypothetical protein BKP37_08510 [Anaerobacillus alkalilacustris]|uniref:DUF2642 domain-containing protein n=1 Tax=Anaerobacillus alkalilacustris TaxID=393763 RepID=A0A1S2LPI8_9BACI|nr:hypothetical protein BKP37_08510 [Anaerobacillus alkalilacustris]